MPRKRISGVGTVEMPASARKRKIKLKRTKVAASLIIRDAADMTDAGARRVATFIQKQLKYLRDPKMRKVLSSTFRARYHYIP